MNFILFNLSTLCLTFSSTKKLRIVLTFLVKNCVKFDKLNELLTTFSDLINVRYDAHSTKIQKLFYKILAENQNINFDEKNCEKDLTNGTTPSLKFFIFFCA